MTETAIKSKPCWNLSKCLACGGTELEEVLNLEPQPLANSYLSSKDEESVKFPLGINICKSCSHVQLTHSVDPELMFRNYSYVSGVSKPMLDFFSEFADDVMNEMPWAKNVLDIGCNDGSQLDCFKKYNLETWGVDPATNLFPETSKRHNVICDFFREGLIQDKKFDIITIQNAFAHTRNQLSLLEAASDLLTDEGRLYIVTSQGDMLKNGEFDTIYHEHLSFYNINSMNELCKRAGVFLSDVARHPVHGNSYIFTISNSNFLNGYIKKLSDDEIKAGSSGVEVAKKFKSRVSSTIKSVEELVDHFRRKDIPIIGYTAPAKGSTFLNASSVRPAFILDNTPMKQFRFVPGTGTPILSESSIELVSSYESVCFIVFAWNVADVIKEKIKSARPGKKDYVLTYFPSINVS